jgi:hypothetical protein
LSGKVYQGPDCTGTRWSSSLDHLIGMQRADQLEQQVSNLAES